ncbi:YihY/virulence factor BrkB family protein [Radiobacillus deserti]|uniref:YihY/virulence factor BrkB family protein n=1 Tax=Radiobacillus deserti TaxID=2594883 RepID=A0A516KDA5_9BACI|nr:YihY/virulence factor BrkB family protein [Radiobacillus deserti]QDP39337.1 YihY/virulence factor BrkB family protein [Radiobacillus deserti]
MRNITSFIRSLIKRLIEDDVFGLAAQLAYFFLLSLFPFLLFLFTLIGYLPFNQLDILHLISDYAPPEIVHMIETNLSELVEHRSGGLLSIGIIGTLWSASNGINAIIRAFNKAYNLEEDRSFIVSRLIAIVLTIFMIVVIVVAFLLPIFGRAIGVYVFSIFGLSAGFLQIWEALRWGVSSVVIIIVLLALYKLAPNKRIRMKNAAVGTVFATLAWQLVSLAFSYYVGSIGNYTATYGSLGGVIVLMIWFYLSGIIIITGGEINALLREMRHKKQDKA